MDKSMNQKLLRYILVVVLPPASVFLAYGAGTTLLISIVLTLIGWVPGIIHALWVLTKLDQLDRPESF
jgi:uncharacterized membrane protein YqaE (UPF0057 family)